MESHEIVIKKLLKQTSLETRFKVYLQMMDYKNWDMGTYKGDQSEIVKTLLEDVEEYLNDTPDPKSNLYE